MYSYDRVLPIGTVVMLKGATRKVMILGYQRAGVDDNEQIFDYCGCIYPDGYLSPEQTAIFNHDQIEKIYAVGLQNDEEAMFQDKLRTIISERENA